MAERETYNERQAAKWILVGMILLVALGTLLGVGWCNRNSIMPWICLAIIIALTPFFYKAADNLNAYILGSRGEYKVWVILNELYSAGYRTINNLELTEQGDIDHVVVGPTGVWAIESKFIDGKIEYTNGQLTRNGEPFKKNYLKQAHAEAFAVRDYLKSKGIDVPVRPVLVFSRQHASVRFGEGAVEGVRVIGAMWLRKTIADHRFGKVLNLEQVTKITMMLEASE